VGEHLEGVDHFDGDGWRILTDDGVVGRCRRWLRRRSRTRAGTTKASASGSPTSTRAKLRKGCTASRRVVAGKPGAFLGDRVPETPPRPPSRSSRSRALELLDQRLSRTLPILELKFNEELGQGAPALVELADHVGADLARGREDSEEIAAGAWVRAR
jgi:hypothetical protein